MPLAVAQDQTGVFTEARPEIVTFAVQLADIRKAEVSDTGELYLLLNSKGRDRLGEITRNHLSKTLQIVIGGHAVSSFTVVTELDSGVLRISDPGVALLKSLEPLL